MIMTIDVGNSSIVFGFYEGEELKYKWYIETDLNKGVKEYNKIIIDIIEANKISKDDIEGISMLSVVPSLTKTIKKAVKPLHKKIILLGKDSLKTGVKVKIDIPGQLGEDMMSNAIAGKRKFQKDFIIVDFGTVTTFQVSDGNGDFIGASIAPGIRKTFQTIYESSPRLPVIDISATKTAKAIGKNTIDAMKSGIYFGFIGGTKEIVRKMKEECGKEDMAICITGGFAGLFEDEPNFFPDFTVDKNITLYGLKLLWDMNN